MRIVKHAIGVFCLLAALLLAVVWVRSYWVGEQVRRKWYADEGTLYVYHYEIWQLSRGHVRWHRTQIGWPLNTRLHVDREQIKEQMPELPLTYWSFPTPARSPLEPWHGFGYEPWGSRTPTGPIAQWGHRVAIPIWLPLLIFAAPGGLWLRGVLRRRRGAHECPNCGYDLRATPDRCPECGVLADTAA